MAAKVTDMATVESAQRTGGGGEPRLNLPAGQDESGDHTNAPPTWTSTSKDKAFGVFQPTAGRRLTEKWAERLEYSQLERGP
jgi:hypothetical protein